MLTATLGVSAEEAIFGGNGVVDEPNNGSSATSGAAVERGKLVRNSAMDIFAQVPTFPTFQLTLC